MDRLFFITLDIFLLQLIKRIYHLHIAGRRLGIFLFWTKVRKFGIILDYLWNCKFFCLIGQDDFTEFNIMFG